MVATALEAGFFVVLMRTVMHNLSISWQGFADSIWLLFLGSLYLYFYREKRRLKQWSTWISVQGQVTKCTWVKEEHELWLRVEYTYYVDQIDYFGDQLYPKSPYIYNKSKYAREIAYKVARAYEEHQDLTVFYNPENPMEAVLDTRLPRKLCWILRLIVILLLIHVSMVVLRWF